MECFNSLLLKLREVHEREVEGWQMKIQELSNKKGCDTKRMEELFTKNQQMKEQQKLLTENIKTLENRLRAGLCDRCTVTQEVAKRRQQEFEASQIQSLQHISLMAGEMNNLKKENKRLRDDIRLLKAALQGGHMDRSSSSSATTEVQPNGSPDRSPTPKPMALISTATGAASIQPADGDVAVKKEADQRSEEAECRQWSGLSRGHNDSYGPLSTLASASAWKTEQNGAHVGERSGEMTHSRHVVHAPVPCRPQPVKTGPVALPWPSVPVGTLLLQPPPKPSQPRFPNLIASSQHGGPRRHTLGALWHKQSAPKPGSAEPTVLFRLKSLSEHVENQIRHQEKPEMTPAKAERVSGEGQREVCDGPLDLSDHGKSKSCQSPRDYSSLVLKGTEGGRSSPDRHTKANPLAHGPITPPVKQQGDEPTGDQKHKVSSEPEEEVSGKTDQSGEKKVPVLTISLRPVVVLETLNSALQKQESLATGEKSSPTAETLGGGNEQEKEEKESGQGYKRKRAEQTEADTDGIQQERKIKITVRAEEQSPNLH